MLEKYAGGSIVAFVAIAQLLLPQVTAVVVGGLIMVVNLAVTLPLPETNSLVGFCIELDTPSPPLTLQIWKEKPAAG